MDNLRAGLTRAVDTIVEYREGLQSHTLRLSRVEPASGKRWASYPTARPG